MRTLLFHKNVDNLVFKMKIKINIFDMFVFSSFSFVIFICKKLTADVSFMDPQIKHLFLHVKVQGKMSAF